MVAVSVIKMIAVILLSGQLRFHQDIRIKILMIDPLKLIQKTGMHFLSITRSMKTYAENCPIFVLNIVTFSPLCSYRYLRNLISSD